MHLGFALVLCGWVANEVAGGEEGCLTLAPGRSGDVAGADQLSREYNGGTLTFAILSPGTAEVLELGGIPADPLVGDTFTLVCREIRGVVIEERQYFVTALRVDGSKVWLSDRKGNGFIVRR